MTSEIIPEDVLNAANRCLMEIDNQRVDAAGRPIHVNRCTVIARAILAERAAERERCAKIAEDEDGRFTWAGMDSTVRLLKGCALEIAAAIRAGEDDGR